MNSHPIHGGRRLEAARMLGKPVNDIVDFSANLNPFGPPASVIDLLQNTDRLLELTAHYPDPEAERLRDALATMLKIPPNNLCCGNGATEMLSHWIGKAKTIALPAPSYGEYLAVTERVGARPVLWNWERTRIDPNTLHDVISKYDPDCVVLPLPNNPTGNSLETAVLKELFDRHGAKRFLIDASFLPVDRDHHDRVWPFLIAAGARMVMSLTKIWSIPGLRLGIAIAPATQLTELRLQLDPWRVNGIAQEAGCLAATDPSSLTQLQDWVGDSRSQFINRLNSQFADGACSDGLCANYFQVAWPEAEAAQLAQRNLASQGILVRSCESFGQSERWRLAVRPEVEQNKLISALSRLP